MAAGSITGTVTVRSRSNPLFHFDIEVRDGTVVGIDNQWDVKLPVWTDSRLDMIMLKDYLSKNRRDLYVEE